MIKSKLIAIVLLSLAISCRKDDKDDTGIPQPGTMTVSIDGVSASFVSTVAIVIDDGGSYRVNVRGYGKASGPSDLLSFTFESYGSITPGTYIENPNPGNNRVMEMYHELWIENPGMYTPVAYSHGNSTEPVTVVVTSVTATSIQGTISGKLKNVIAGSPDVTYSNGKFNALY